MGLLDDAIREHLELKRRHGADPGEIERQEHEAFGAAARADDEARAQVEPDLDESGEDPAPYDDEALPAEGAGDAPGAVRAEDFAADAPTSVYIPEDAEPERDTVEPPPGEDEPPPPGDEAGATGYDEDPWVDDDERHTQAPPQDAAQPAEDDVLEETPDFLQETPEHDRLWFEQKPPRDFDWDR